MFIGIGSNIDAETNMHTCASLLRTQYPTIVFSHVYKTAPRDALDQDDFLNAVAKIETDHTPTEVQNTLVQIEQDLGKNPPYPKGPRTIDLDILLYGDEQIEQEGLQVPHPRMHERRFVLEPLLELTNDQKWQQEYKKNNDQSSTQTDISL